MDDIEATLDAIWCVDSETGQEVLINRRTNEIIMRRDRTWKEQNRKDK